MSKFSLTEIYSGHVHIWSWEKTFLSSLCLVHLVNGVQENETFIGNEIWFFSSCSFSKAFRVLNFILLSVNSNFAWFEPRKMCSSLTRHNKLPLQAARLEKMETSKTSCIFFFHFVTDKTERRDGKKWKPINSHVQFLLIAKFYLSLLGFPFSFLHSCRLIAD